MTFWFAAITIVRMAVHQVQFDMDATRWCARASSSEQCGHAVKDPSHRYPGSGESWAKRTWAYFAHQYNPYDIAAALLGEPIFTYWGSSDTRFSNERKAEAGIYWIVSEWKRIATERDEDGVFTHDVKTRLAAMDKIRDIHRMAMQAHPVFSRILSGEVIEDAPSDAHDGALMNVIHGRGGRTAAATA